MIGKMQHHVLLQYDVCNAVGTSDQWMRKWFFTLPLSGKHIREIHKMPEIMYSSAWNDRSFFCQVKSFDQIIQEVYIHLLIIDKTNEFPLTPVLQTFFNFFNE